MSDATVKPIDRLHLETRLFVEWLEHRGFADEKAPTRERLKALCDAAPAREYQAIWDEVFADSFAEWMAAVRKEICGEDLPSVVRVLLDEEEQEPPAARETLRTRIRKLQERIEGVAGEDEEFQSDLAEMEKSLLTYGQVLEQFGGDPRLDEVVRRGVKQALMVKERDFEWLEALLERLRSEKEAEAARTEEEPGL